MNTRFVLTPSARADLEETWDDVARRFDPETAERVPDSLESALPHSWPHSSDELRRVNHHRPPVPSSTRSALDYADELGLGARIRSACTDRELRLLGRCSVRFNGRFKKVLGRVRTDPRRREQQMELAAALRGFPDELRATFLHECAHAITPRERGHGAAFREAALRIGADPRPTTQSEAMQTTLRVVARCSGCGYEVKRRRALARGRAWVHAGRRGCGGALLEVRS